LSAQTPTPVLLAKVTGAFNSANMSVVLGDGEVSKGRWSTEPRAQVPKGATTANTLSADGMPSRVGYRLWFGILCVPYPRHQALRSVCAYGRPRKTVLNVEMYRPATKESNIRDSIKGVAKDNKDNLYKLTF
jgi:hypothetical protein